jgi:hypothetical protein
VDEGAVEVGALEEGPELLGLPVVVGVEPEPVLPPASSLPPQAARIGALAPTRAAIAAQRSMDRRSRIPSGVGSVGGAGATAGDPASTMVSSLMNLDLQELAGQSS